MIRTSILLRHFLPAMLIATIVVSKPVFSQTIDVEAPSARFVTAVAGLKMRSPPSATAETVTTIPYLQIVTWLGESPEVETIGGASGHWTKVKFAGSEGWAFGAYLGKFEDLVKPGPSESDFHGLFQGTNQCKSDKSHLCLKKDHTFSGWIYGGAEMGGCFGDVITGTWRLSDGSICLFYPGAPKAPCFSVSKDGRLIPDVARGPAIGETYVSSFVSGWPRTAMTCN